MKTHHKQILAITSFISITLAVWPSRGQAISTDSLKPSPRYALGMAYDSDQKKAILFGGYYHGETLGDMWEWDGTHWSKIGQFNACARSVHALTYDRARKRVVMFGGLDSAARLDDTWEFDGSSWVRKNVSGPPALSAHQMVYVAKKEMVILFGGMDRSRMKNGDTWEYDGSSWKKIDSSGPSARSHHGMVYDEERGAVVLFGGNVSTSNVIQDALRGLRSDTWEWDGKRWKEIPITGPPARDHHAMAYDAGRKRVVLFGGFNGTYLGDTWEYDGQGWVQVDSTGPPLRGGKPGMVYDDKRGRILLFGGGIGGGTNLEPQAMNDTWEWDGRQWKLR